MFKSMNFEEAKIEFSPGINVFIGEDEVLSQLAIFNNRHIDGIDRTEEYNPNKIIYFSDTKTFHLSDFSFPYSEEYLEEWKKQILTKILNIVRGKMIRKNNRFYLCKENKELEFRLLNPDIYRICLLWILIKDGILSDKSLFFWDEPEKNIRPHMIKDIVSILLELHKQGVQMFIMTHSYFFIKEFDLQMEKDDNIIFHSLYTAEDTGKIEVMSTNNYSELAPNPIDDIFGSMVDREIKKSMRGLGND